MESTQDRANLLDKAVRTGNTGEECCCISLHEDRQIVREHEIFSTGTGYELRHLSCH